MGLVEAPAATPTICLTGIAERPNIEARPHALRLQRLAPAGPPAAPAVGAGVRLRVCQLRQPRLQVQGPKSRGHSPVLASRLRERYRCCVLWALLRWTCAPVFPFGLRRSSSLGVFLPWPTQRNQRKRGSGADCRKGGKYARGRVRRGTFSPPLEVLKLRNAIRSDEGRPRSPYPHHCHVRWLTVCRQCLPRRIFPSPCSMALS